MPRRARPTYVADFETIVNEDRTNVWLWGVVDIRTEAFTYGNTIEQFIELMSQESANYYFHNLKFDGNFIVYWLLTNGYKHSGARHLEPKQFNTLISDMGLWYSIEICFSDGVKVKIMDSLKQITMSVAEMPKAFGLDINKLEIDYEAVTDITHVATDDEIEYVKNDCLIVARALNEMHRMGLKKMTAASNALNDYRTRLGRSDFDYYFPQLTLTEDRDIRASYKGGWTYVNPKYQGLIVGAGQVYDVNSMYPWAMKYCELPYGSPEYYEGKYKKDDEFPLYVQSFICEFKLKPMHYPSIQLKGNLRFMESEYIVESDEPTLMCLTSVDLALFEENYDIYNIQYLSGYKFRSSRGLFSEYIDYWYEVKKKAKAEGNMPMSHVAKLMLNSLYGKFGSNPIKRSKYPWYDEEDDIVRYEMGAEEETKGGYVAMASFITSYCRDKIIRSANACGDRFMYADTDSIHILGEEPPDIDIDEYRLGAFKLESRFERAKYLRPKCYIEEYQGNMDKKCAGLPKSARDKVTFETMVSGSVFGGKLVPKIVPGGVVLVERQFTIK